VLVAVAAILWSTVPRAILSSPVPPIMAHCPGDGEAPITWSVDPLNLFTCAKMLSNNHMSMQHAVQRLESWMPKELRILEFDAMNKTNVVSHV
jgi:hypothetical protein